MTGLSVDTSGTVSGTDSDGVGVPSGGISEDPVDEDIPSTGTGVSLVSTISHSPETTGRE